MTNWIDHDGSDECPIGRDVRCYVLPVGGSAIGPLPADHWHWPLVHQYRLADDSALLDAPPETHAGEEGSYEAAPADTLTLRDRFAMAALPAVILGTERLIVARIVTDDNEAAELVACTVGRIADACLAERAKGGPSNG